MNNISTIRNRCCGCGACVAICPKTAIIMREDIYGFVYPIMDNIKCIHCGLCDKVCPELSSMELYEPQAVYAAHCNDREELESSSSGGAASILSKNIIRKGGVVYGCSQTNYRTISHIRIECECDLFKLKGSKYVQSDVCSVYSGVKSDLLSDRKVLFIGTPCQVGALRNYLQKQYDNLYCIDLVCHGVPSQAMLRNYVETKYVSYDKLSINFRWKTKYGIQFGMQFVNGEKILKSTPARQDAYMTAFLSGLSYRESCHCCKYARRERVGDITIGDFWGLGKDKPSSIDHRHGVSLIMINTDRGAELYKDVKEHIISEKHDIKEAVKYNWNLHDPSPRPVIKDKFMKLYSLNGMEKAVWDCVLKYRIESIAIIRFIRRIPILNKSIGLIIRLIRNK